MPYITISELPPPPLSLSKRKKNKNKNSKLSERIHPFLKKDLREKIDLIRFDWSNLDHQIPPSPTIVMSSTITARSLLLLAFISLLLSPALAFNANHKVNGRFDSSNPICSILFCFDSCVLPGFARVMGWPAGSTGSCRFFIFTGLSPNPDRSSHRVDPPSWSGFNNYNYS